MNFANEHSYFIPMIDAADIFMISDAGLGVALYKPYKKSNGSTVMRADGSLFSSMFRFCLETPELENSYASLKKGNFVQDINDEITPSSCTDALVCVTFEKNYREFNRHRHESKEKGSLFVRNGYAYKDGVIVDKNGGRYEITDCACVSDGELIAIVTSSNTGRENDQRESVPVEKKTPDIYGYKDQLVWDHMKTVISYVACHEDYFREYMEEQLKIEGDSKLKLMKKQLAKATRRMEELDKLFTKTYEDNALGKLTDERFVKITSGYDSEQKQLEEEILQLENDIRLQEENSNNIDKFVELIKSHFEDNGLNNYNAHEIIKAIYIENCDEEITDANSIEEETDNDFESIVFNITSRNTPKNIRRVRKIHIKYDFVGFIPINELMNKKGDSE